MGLMNKSIFIALAGAPNAGKSTLINKLVNQKIAIVTSKCQTTRFNTKGIVNVGSTQLVFIDTPGLFEPGRLLEKGIVKQARQGLYEADLVCLVVDASSKSDVAVIMQKIQSLSKSVVLLLNKVDLLKDKSSLLDLAKQFNQSYAIDATFMISGKKGTGIKEFIQYIQKVAPERPWMFEGDIASDITDRRLAEEVTREALYYGLGAELPYALEVQTEVWEERQDSSLKVHQVIHILKDSQKKIILGKQGQKLKSIGQRSREQLSKILGQRVHLFLYVKVKPDWVERRTAIDMQSDI